jgi:hypothetical protein
MKSGSWASFCAAAPPEVYPGEPDGECIHGIPDGIDCPDCIRENLNREIFILEDECADAEDRADRLAVIADALAAELEISR